jgi:hypothetical protein
LKKYVLFLLFLFLFAIVGCSEKEQVIERNQLSESAEIVKSYLEEKGYDVISLVSDFKEVLTLEYLESIRGQQEWNVQSIKPDKFIGKTIDRVMFVVKNHPLNEKYDGEIRVNVFLYQNEVIGGTSFALDYDGALNYLDGEK